MQENKNIDRILNSLQGAGLPEANPFMLTRILAKAKEVQKPSAWNTVFSFLQNPAGAFSLVLLVLAINAVFLYNNSRPSFNVASGVSTAATLKADFNIDFNSIYDIENTEQ